MKVRGRTLGDDYTRDFIVKNFKEKDFSSFTSVKSAVNAKADEIIATAKNDARNDVIMFKARQITRQIVGGRGNSHNSQANTDLIRSQIATLSQALSILNSSSGGGGSVNLGLEMTLAGERSEIERAINTLQDMLSSESAREEASIVLYGR